MEDKKAMVLEQLRNMQEGAQCCVEHNVRYYVMHASCAVEFAKNVQELLQTETYGTVKEGFFLREYVGDGETESGKKFDLSVSAADRSPMIVCGKKGFHLSWDDILDLADKAGLFSEVVKCSEN